MSFYADLGFNPLWWSYPAGISLTKGSNNNPYILKCPHDEYRYHTFKINDIKNQNKSLTIAKTSSVREKKVKRKYEKLFILIFLRLKNCLLKILLAN